MIILSIDLDVLLFYLHTPALEERAREAEPSRQSMINYLDQLFT